MEDSKGVKKKKSNRVKELQERVQKLALTIDEVEDEKLEVENQLKRALADYHNLLKNSEKRDQIRLLQIKKELFEIIIPTLDALMLGIVASKDVKIDEKGKSWLEGIQASVEGLMKALREIGFEQYMPQKGQEFDGEIHEAVATVPEGKKGEIYDTVQPGYILNDSVVRPARVVVSK